MKFQLEVSDADLAAIGHAVVDPTEWAQHAFEHVGAAAVRDKIAKYTEEYQAALAKYGAGYKTRAVREAEKEAAELEEKLARRAAEREAAAPVIAEAQADVDARFETAVAAAVERALARRVENPPAG